MLNLAGQHGLLPICCRELDALGINLEPAVRTRVADAGRGAAAWALAGAGQLAEVYAALRGGGITCVPYKGPSLAMDAYGDVALRAFDDLDIVVTPAHADAAYAVVARLGYQPPRGASWREAREAGNWQGHAALVRNDATHPLELHWRFCDRKLPWNPSVRDIHDRATIVSLGGAEIPLPAPEDQVVLVLLHAAKHGWDRLESFVCAAALLARDLDFGRLMAAAGDVGGTRACLVGLGATARLLGTALPPAMAEAVGDRRVAPLVDDAVRRVRSGASGDRRDAGLHVALLDSPADRAKYIALAALLPTPADRAAIRLPRVLQPLYPLVRVGRLAWRSFTR